MIPRKKGKLNKIISIATFLGVAMLFSCEEVSMQDIRKLQPKDLSDLPTVVFKDMNLTYYDSGRVNGILRAPTMVSYDNFDVPYKEFPEGLHVDFYKDGKPSGYLRADYAVLRDVSDKLYEARGHVVVVNEKNDSIVSDHLLYDPNTERIYNEIPTDLYFQGNHIYSFGGMDAASDLSNYTLKENSGTLKAAENN